MAMLVVDASVALAWCFEDETTLWTETLLEQVRTDGEVVVPAHWPVEVSNGMLAAVRRKRIPPQQPPLLWDKLNSLYSSVEPPLRPGQIRDVFRLCERHGLTVYDATYLELALRKAIPLATLDAALQRAAVRENAAWLPQN